MKRLIKALLATLCGACASTSPRGAAPPAGHRDPGHPEAHHGHHSAHAFADPDASSKTLDDPSRDVWQRPHDVLRALELDATMSVADVGAGTGYFAVRLARAVSRGEVIATDLEPGMVRFLTERARREQLPNLRAVLATPASSGLAVSSVDRILIVHVWHHLTDRSHYAREMAAALRPGGRVFIVDFSLDAQRGPPFNMRVTPEAIIEELEGAGLSAKVSAVAIPDQYIVEARLDH